MQYASSKDFLEWSQGAPNAWHPIARLSLETGGGMNKKGLAPVTSCHTTLFGRKVRKGRSFAYRHPLYKNQDCGSDITVSLGSGYYVYRNAQTHILFSTATPQLLINVNPS